MLLFFCFVFLSFSFICCALQIYIRGGHIIPMQGPGLTTVQSRKNPYSLIVALDQYGRAAGSLYLDNGENITTSK